MLVRIGVKDGSILVNQDNLITLFPTSIFVSVIDLDPNVTEINITHPSVTIEVLRVIEHLITHESFPSVLPDIGELRAAANYLGIELLYCAHLLVTHSHGHINPLSYRTERYFPDLIMTAMEYGDDRTVTYLASLLPPDLYLARYTDYLEMAIQMTSLPLLRHILLVTPGDRQVELHRLANMVVRSWHDGFLFLQQTRNLNPLEVPADCSAVMTEWRNVVMDDACSDPVILDRIIECCPNSITAHHLDTMISPRREPSSILLNFIRTANHLSLSPDAMLYERWPEVALTAMFDRDEFTVDVMEMIMGNQIDVISDWEPCEDSYVQHARERHYRILFVMASHPKATERMEDLAEVVAFLRAKKLEV